jgi:hypothetical protein
VGVCVAKKVILVGPQIPYVTATVRSIDVWHIFLAFYKSPQTLFSFLIATSFNAGRFIWRSCNTVSAFFNEIAIKSENERLILNKSKVYDVWKKIINETIPKNRPI